MFEPSPQDFDAPPADCAAIESRPVPGGDLTAFARDEEAMLRGRATYVDDMQFDGEVHGHVLRSPHAHALIRSIDASRALACPGVLAVLTASDIADDVEPLGCAIPLTSFGGEHRATANRPILAKDRARHIGEGIAFVVATTLAQAVEAASFVELDYEILPANEDLCAGTAASQIWDGIPNNVCFDWQFGDGERCDRLFATAKHVVDIALSIPRLVVNPIETRAAIGLHDGKSDSYTLVANTQGVHFVRNVLAKAMHLESDRLRVVTPNVGGAFGSKIYAYPEHALVLLAARRVGRPVRWTSTRQDAVLSDTQGRGHRTRASLALDEHGRFLALRVSPTVDLGACLSQLTPLTATGVGAPVQGGAYRFEALDIRVRGVFTNKVPVDAFRGAGRPEATYVLERLIDRAARTLGIDPAELRARNLPEATSDRVTAVTGLAIEGGRFLDNQRRCLKAADRAGFAGRRSRARRDGLLRGFGFANYLEANGGLQVAEAINPANRPVESAALRFRADGSLDIVLGTQSSGQDHERPMALRAVDCLGLAPAAITVREGDSLGVSVGSGTGGSKSLLTSTVALDAAIAAVVGRGRATLARLWGVEAATIGFAAGLFREAGSNRTMSIRELAAAEPGSLDGEAHASLDVGSSANGCHACEVEIDPETGEVRILRYTAVDDFGVVVNEAAVRGQVQGGVAQGIGQALTERAPGLDALAHVVATSPFGHAMQRAAEIPTVDWIDNGLPSRTNSLGAKACGESGISAAPPAVMNAIEDALFGIADVDAVQMPVRAAELWRILAAGLPVTAEGATPA